MATGKTSNKMPSDKLKIDSDHRDLQLSTTLDGIPEREISWMERRFGPEIYRLLKGLITNPLSIIGIILLSFFVVIALAAPIIAPPANPNQPYQIPRDGFHPTPKEPGTLWERRPPELPSWWESVMGTDQWTHIMGTASGQWDIFYGVVWGTRTAFRAGIIVTFATVTIGILIGAVSAYYGGFIDNILMRITDTFLAFPFLVAAITAATILTPIMGRSIVPSIIALIIFGWMGYARLIRGEILSVKQRDYVMAGRVIGASDSRILFRHIIPNAIFPTLVVASMDVGTYVLTLSALSFLGIGPPLGYADWGSLLSFARDWINDLADYWYVVAYPGFAVVLFVLAWNLIGDAVRDLFDPRLRGSN